MRRSNALLIGCGWIGATADLCTKEVLTYAKALSEYPNWNVFVYDPNKQNVSKICKHYGYKRVADFNELDLTNFDLAIVASPTETHVNYLEKLLEVNIPRIICEKPVCINSPDLNKLSNVLKKSSSAVFVNYNRNYSSIFKEIQIIISREYQNQNPSSITITYQRGLLNNCSHAINLCQMLLQKKFQVSNFCETARHYDHLSDDPTLSGYGNWDSSILTLNGLTGIEYPVMEILINFEDGYISIYDCATKIKVYKKNASQRFQRLEKCNELYSYHSENNITRNVLIDSFKQKTDPMQYVGLSLVLEMTQQLICLIENNTKRLFNQR